MLSLLARASCSAQRACCKTIDVYLRNPLTCLCADQLEFVLTKLRTEVDSLDKDGCADRRASCRVCAEAINSSCMLRVQRATQPARVSACACRQFVCH